MERIQTVKGTTIPYTAVDEERARVYEDAFRIRYHGGNTQVDVAAIVPPLGALDARNFFAALCAHLGAKKGARLPFLFNESDRMSAGFKEGQARKAVVCSYLLNGRGVLVEEHLCVTSVMVQHHTYEEYSQNLLIKRSLEVADRLMQSKRHAGLKTFAQNKDSAKDAAADGPAGKLVHSLLLLFNDSCKTYASKHRIPYVRREGRNGNKLDGYCISQGFAKFNCGLRDPSAFINASNLSAQLTQTPSPYPERDLRKLLPHVNN